jgi:tyrosinase
MGYPLPRAGADGNFGPETRAAVIRFQTDRRQVLPAMAIDGIVGPETMGQLDEAIVTLRVRRDVTTLTPAERTALAAAINSLKTSGVYHAFVRDHSNSMSTAHRQSAFLPWHRAFILNFESELRAIDPTVSLPYWNWSADPGVVGGNPLWNSAMVAVMGGNGTGANNAVTTGPFAGWLVANSSGTVTALPLQRTFGVDQPTLPPLSEVTRALGLVPYDASPWDDANTASGFRNEIEGWAVSNRTGKNALHNAVHVWVGGSMEPGTSPNDPCFFLHHCFIDKLWADWQAAFPSRTYLPATSQPRPSGVNAFGIRDDMAISQVTSPTPFTVKPAEALNNRVLRDQRGTRGIVVRYV